MRSYLFLIAAIFTEVVGTMALARSEVFTRLVPSAVTVVAYCLSFWCMAIALRAMSTGVVYAIWSGLGIVLIALVAWLWDGQKLDSPALIGLGLIILGVAVINLFSGSVSH